jgi:enterochelin esterase-like enzyme
MPTLAGISKVFGAYTNEWLQGSWALIIGLVCFATLPVHAGLWETNLASKFIGSRGIHIYLPPSYDSQPARRYPVLYLHDGQNVFSSAGTNCAFGWGSWELDKTADDLSRSNLMREVIMVGVDNDEAHRLEEYSGRRATNGAPPTAYENYSRFLCEELKPWVDVHFRTLSEAKNTGVMGSSLGGLISMTLAWEHPEVFGNAACLSGAFSFNDTNFLNDGLKKYSGKPKPVHMYLDSGMVDYRGGDDNRALTEQAAAELKRTGWTDQNLELFVDPPLTPHQIEKSGLRHDKWAEARTQHNEFYWRLRAWRALTFMFPQ